MFQSSLSRLFASLALVTVLALAAMPVTSALVAGSKVVSNGLHTLASHDGQAAEDGDAGPKLDPHG